jgi:hypothetical protein
MRAGDFRNWRYREGLGAFDVSRHERQPRKHLATCLTNRGVPNLIVIPPGSFTGLHLAAKRALYLQLLKVVHVSLHN